MARVLWPVRSMATRSGTLARIRLRAAVRRQSWRKRVGTPAAWQAVRQAVRQRRTGMPSRWKTSGLSGSRRARRRASASAMGCEMGSIRPTNVFVAGHPRPRLLLRLARRQRLQRAYHRPAYAEARRAITTLHAELDERNPSAAGSLAEGLDETLTLHRLGLFGVLGRSLKTTNSLESVNALVEDRCAKVDHWQNSSQRQRWLATALLDIEPRLRKVAGYCHLPKLRAEIKRELKIDTTTANKEGA